MKYEWLDEGETVLHEGRTLYYLDRLRALPGRMVLTDRRLYLESHGNPFMGILLKLFFKNHRRKVVVDAPPADLKLTVEKYLRADRLVITLPNGEVKRALIDPGWKQALKIADA